MYYQIINAGNENIGVVWDRRNEKIKIKKIYLPEAKNKLLQRIKNDFSPVEKKPRKLPDGLARTIAALYQGKMQKVSLSALDMSELTSFAKKVLIQTWRIPRGRVASYSSLAAKTGRPRAARAAGKIMANNPFPIVVPCHRVIRADGTLGGFGGGLKMKKIMLQREGVKLDIAE